jgi:hypothetical protein
MLWKWKLARDLDDVLHVLNGETRYDRPAPDVRVCMTWRGDHPQFWVFATKAETVHEPHDGLGDWGCKVVTEADDALSFLRGDAPGSRPVVQAQIAAAWAGDHHRFYVLYRNGDPVAEQPPVAGDWAWMRAADPAGALSFLNSGSTSAGPVTTARIAAAHRHDQDDFFIFYRQAAAAGTVDSWRWRAVGSADDVRGAVHHKRRSPVDFQLAAPGAGGAGFQLFTSPEARAGQHPALAGAHPAAV